MAPVLEGMCLYGFAFDLKKKGSRLYGNGS